MAVREDGFVTRRATSNDCPVCGKAAIMVCKCPMNDSYCANGHHWHVCLIHGKVVIGKADHAKGIEHCHCNDFINNDGNLL
jgi:hypothetical protein